MHNLIIGMNEILKNEKHDYIFEIQPSFATDLKTRKHVVNSRLMDMNNSVNKGDQ
jgi:hypothetical protein